MEQWRHRTIVCSLEDVKDANGKKYRDWVVNFTDGDQVVGMEEILKQEGEGGWELVSAVAERTEGHQFQYSGTSVSRYRFFFKKRV